MKEWSKKSEFNSFNSWKGLLYADWYKAIVKGEFKPPVEASLDPIHACNLNCSHCNAHRYLDKEMKMPDEHLMQLVKFLGKWGVKAICFGGGGEATLHPFLAKAIRLTVELGMEASLATNGTVWSEELIDALCSCRWVGVSVDAASVKIYEDMKKRNLFSQVLSNIKKLAERKSNCDIAYKFLINNYNQGEIYDACVIAKNLGVRDFHVRPCDPNHQGCGDKSDNIWKYDVELIKEQFEKCHELEDDNFRIFTIVHKFDEDFKPKKDFSQCYAAPLCIQLCADGLVYFCPDQRHQEYFELGTHHPYPENILNFWGREKHKALVFGGIPERCRTRCTFGAYCRQCEQLFAGNRDPMHWRFV